MSSPDQIPVQPTTSPVPGSYDYYFQQALDDGTAEGFARRDREEVAAMYQSRGLNPYAADAYVPFRNNFENLVRHHADACARIRLALSRSAINES